MGLTGTALEVRMSQGGVRKGTNEAGGSFLASESELAPKLAGPLHHFITLPITTSAPKPAVKIATSQPMMVGKLLFFSNVNVLPIDND